MPDTIEDAQKLITQLQSQVTDLTEKNAKVIQEKKDAIELFNKEDKDGMTDTEKKLADALEKSNSEIKSLNDKIESDSKVRNDRDTQSAKESADRIQKSIEERITKASKGDTNVADKLRANVGLLDKMSKTSDSELDTVVNTAFNMMGTKEANPMAMTNNTSSGTPVIDVKANYADTEAGKAVAKRIGLSIETKATEAKAPETK